MVCYHSSVVKALEDLFPDIGFDKAKFIAAQNPNPWRHSSNRRAFFEEYAKRSGFDPLVPDNWYSVKLETISALPNGTSVLYFYGGSLVKALVNLFPELEWDEIRFESLPKHYWTDFKNRRLFFEKLAKSCGFEPLVAGNWYKIPKELIAAEKGGGTLIVLYNGSIYRALRHLFPEMKLEEEKFSRKQMTSKGTVQRQLLEKVAHSMGFDPLIPQNWYSAKSSTVVTKKDARNLLRHHHRDYRKAVATLFTDIGVDATKIPPV